MIVAQAAIAVFGVTAVWLSQDPRESRRKWAPLIGLAAQPFWFVETIGAEQWGMVALCAVYSVAWARGVWSFWLAPRHA